MHQPDPTFPPLITGHDVKAPLIAWQEACRRAAIGEIGAADLVWSRNTQRAEVALVLEPAVPLARACQMAALGFIALSETLGHVGPPQMPVGFRWPDTLLINGAPCGTVRLIAPGRNADAVPPWLVLSISIAVSSSHLRAEPGELLHETALDLEGAGDVTRTAVVETLSRCLLAWLHSWSDAGFRQIADHWLFAADGRDRDITLDGVAGRVVGLDEEGDALLKTADGRVRVVPYLAHVDIWPKV